jgi:hypothetical protein
MEAQYDYPASALAQQQTEDFKEGVKYEQAKGLPKNSPLTVR